MDSGINSIPLEGCGDMIQTWINADARKDQWQQETKGLYWVDRIGSCFYESNGVMINMAK